MPPDMQVCASLRLKVDWEQMTEASCSLTRQAVACHTEGSVVLEQQHHKLSHEGLLNNHTRLV